MEVEGDVDNEFNLEFLTVDEKQSIPDAVLEKFTNEWSRQKQEVIHLQIELEKSTTHAGL